MKQLFLIVLTLLLCLTGNAQQIEISKSRKNVRTSGDVLAAVIPATCLVSTLVLQDWEGLKQGAFSGMLMVGVGYGLKFAVDKERPDKSNDRSFPSLHTGISFTGAAFLQRRYGWKWGAPAYAVASYVGWSRVYAKKHDWWDVAAGAAIGVGSAYLFTKPFALKHNLTIVPVAGNQLMGFYASFDF